MLGVRLQVEAWHSPQSRPPQVSHQSQLYQRRPGFVD